MITFFAKRYTQETPGMRDQYKQLACVHNLAALLLLSGQPFCFYSMRMASIAEGSEHRLLQANGSVDTGSIHQHDPLRCENSRLKSSFYEALALEHAATSPRWEGQRSGGKGTANTSRSPNSAFPSDVRNSTAAHIAAASSPYSPLANESAPFDEWSCGGYQHAGAADGGSADKLAAEQCCIGSDSGISSQQHAENSTETLNQQAQTAKPAPEGAIARSTSSSAPMIHTSAAVGMLLTLFSTFAFSVMALFVSLSSRKMKMSAFQLTSVRFFIQGAASVVSVLVFRWKTVDNVTTWCGKRKNRWLLVSRGVWGAMGMSSYFYALAYPGARLADVTTLVFTNVPFTAVLARILLKEPYTRYDALTGVLCMVGVVLVAQPPAIFGSDDAASQPTPWIVVVVSLFGAVTSAMAYVTIRQIGRNEDTLIMVLYFSVVGSIVAPICAAIAQVTWVTPDDAVSWLMYLSVGITGFLGQLLLNRGVQTAPAGPATVMRYADVIFAIIFQATIYSETPNWLKWVGCLLVMSCMVAVYVKYRRNTMGKEGAPKAASTLTPATTLPTVEVKT